MKINKRFEREAGEGKPETGGEGMKDAADRKQETGESCLPLVLCQLNSVILDINHPLFI